MKIWLSTHHLIHHHTRLIHTNIHLYPIRTDWANILWYSVEEKLMTSVATLRTSLSLENLTVYAHMDSWISFHVFQVSENLLHIVQYCLKVDWLRICTSVCLLICLSSIHVSKIAYVR